MKKEATKRIEEDVALQKSDFLKLKVCGLFDAQVATFTSLSLLVNYDAKQKIKLEIDASSYAIFEISSPKYDLE